MAKKKTPKQQNPFICEGYVSPEYFCDRTEETENMISALRNGRNITLISPRKIGKTGLIKHVFHQLKEQNKDAICLYVDIFSTQNLHEFIELLSKTIVEDALRKERSMMAKVLEAFSSWRPVLSPDPLSGAPTVTVSIDPVKTLPTLKSIFDHLNSLQKEVYIAIDEFQQINEYPEKGTEALLRSHIQFMQNVGFIFSGSKQHLMSEMFSSPRRPFYQSTQFVNLFPLHEEIYYDFARSFFEPRHGDFSKDVFHDIYERFDGQTWYVQSVLNRLYQSDEGVKTVQQANNAILAVLNTMSVQYEGLMAFLTPNQLSLLKAIARAGCVERPQATSFIKQYDLPSPSSIKTALDVLLEKDIIYHTQQGYIVYDRFMQLWLKRLFG